MIDAGYKDYIKYVAENRKNEMVYNSSAEHAIVVLSELIKNAKHYVHIVCKNMDPAVTNDECYLEAVESFLENESSKELSILLTDSYNSSQKSEIFELLKRYPKKVVVRSLENKIQITSKDRPINWTVSDDTAYRIEIDIDNCIAVGNFNDSAMAKRYNDHFKRFFTDDNLSFKVEI